MDNNCKVGKSPRWGLRGAAQKESFEFCGPILKLKIDDGYYDDDE